jgi:hypothetical protein
MGRFARLQFQLLVARVADALPAGAAWQTVFWTVASSIGHKKDFLANFDFAGGKD